jgi:probable blue pigment (indigoidine) exporter
VTDPAPAPPSFRITGLDVVLLAAVGLVWGAAYVFIRQGIVLGATPLLFASIRYAFSAAAFAALAAARREAFPGRRAFAISAGIGGTLIIGAYGGFLYWGEQYTTGGYAAVLASTAPILTVVVAYSMLPDERLRPAALVGLLLGFAGTVVLVVPELAGGPIGTWEGPPFLIAAFVAAAFGTVLLRRLGGGRQGLYQIGTQFGVGALLLAVAAAIVPTPEAFPVTTGTVEALVALVVLSSVMGYFLYFTLHHRVGPVRANTVAYIVPLVGIGIGSGFYGEPISLFEVVGFLIVVGGLTLLLRASTRPS